MANSRAPRTACPLDDVRACPATSQRLVDTPAHVKTPATECSKQPVVDTSHSKFTRKQHVPRGGTERYRIYSEVDFIGLSPHTTSTYAGEGKL